MKIRGFLFFSLSNTLSHILLSSSTSTLSLCFLFFLGNVRIGGRVPSFSPCLPRVGKKKATKQVQTRFSGISKPEVSTSLISLHLAVPHSLLLLVVDVESAVLDLALSGLFSPSFVMSTMYKSSNPEAL